MSGKIDDGVELYRRALVEQNAGRPARALELLGRALRRVDAFPAGIETDELVTRIWTSTAYSRAECRDFDSGLEAIEVALARAAAADNEVLLAEALAQRALIALRAGRLELADHAFAAVGLRLQHLGNLARVSVLLNKGNLHLTRHELSQARQAFRQVVDVAASDLSQQRFKALHNLAYTEFLAGDLPLALKLMDQAGRIEADVSRAIWFVDRSRVLTEAGLISDADRDLADAGEMLRRDRTFQDLGESELERARCALVSDDPASARRFATSARNRFRRRGNDHWRRAAELVLLEADLADGRPGRRLVAPAERLRTELTEAGLRGPERQASVLIAEAHASYGAFKSAELALKTLGRDTSDPVSLRLRRRHVEALIDSAAGRRARAGSRIASGLALLADYQAQFGCVDLSTAAAVHGRRLAQLDVELAVQTGKPEKIFAAAERGRSATSRLAAVRPPADPETAELLGELRQVVEMQRVVELNPRLSASTAVRRRALEVAIAERAWSRRGGGEVTAPVSVHDTAVALGNSELASFVVSGGSIGGVVIRDGRSSFLTLADRSDVIEIVRRMRADLDVLAQPRLPAPMATAVRGSFERSATRLDSLLIRPLGLSAGRVVIVTTGLLGQVPWATLPSLHGRPVEVVPSATAWVAAKRIGKRVGGSRLVSVAGPGLTRSAAEAAAVAHAWKQSTSINGTAATTSALAKAMSSARVVHVAAHGTHQNENPLFSSIRLADGPLFAHELDQTAGTPEHVVLSACELGLATIRPGDEALGLTSVLLRLGTRSVVAGVARIGDDLAADSMAAYHRKLVRGMDSAAALAEVSGAAEQPLPLVNFGASWSLK